MPEPPSESRAPAVDDEGALISARLARLISTQFDFVWRLLRRIGITEHEADTAAQEVFSAATQRIGDIRPGSERSFLFSTTLHVAARTRRNREEQPVISDNALALEDLDQEQQAREVLGALLEQMSLELRVVFVLREIEQLSNAEIAEIIGIPESMVVSRLTDAQEDFATHLESDSDYSVALINAAREERAPRDAVSRALKAAGLGAHALTTESEQTEKGASRVGVRTGVRSPFALATKWLVLGWLAGLVASSLVYALNDAASASAAMRSTRGESRK